MSEVLKIWRAGGESCKVEVKHRGGGAYDPPASPPLPTFLGNSNAMPNCIMLNVKLDI